MNPPEEAIFRHIRFLRVLDAVVLLIVRLSLEAEK